MATNYGDLKNRIVADVSYQGHAYARNTAASTSMTFTLPPWKPGMLAVVSAFWDTETVVTTPTGWTNIVNNEDGTEYPEGRTMYRILQSGDSDTLVVSGSTSTYNAGVLVLYSTNSPITTVTIGNTAWSDGPSALNSTRTADTPTTVASGTVRLLHYALTGRIQPTYIQNPTPTFAQSGWTRIEGDTQGSLNSTDGPDNMDFAYKILRAGVTDVSEQITTNDTGRQAHHIMGLTLS